MIKLDNEQIQQLAKEIHEQNVSVGWWDAYPNKTDRYDTAMMLVVSELAEAMEGDRKNRDDDHLPHHKMFDVELADAIIRVLDLVGAYDVNIYTVFGDSDAVDALKERVGSRSRAELLWDMVLILALETMPEEIYNSFINYVILVCEDQNIDIWQIVNEKREYNANRADHKRENRNADGGKKY